MFAGIDRTVNFSKPRKSTINRALRALGSFLAPPQCVLCDRPGLPGPLDLCAECLTELPRSPGDDPIPAGGFDLICCPWSFDFPVDALVRALKFHGERCHARLLGTLLARERARLAAPFPDRVIPVPLHFLRLRARGYNQAGELARFAARELALPFHPTALYRQRPTREQTGLSSTDRAANVRAAFAATRALPGARIALVDDVVTTGSTVATAAAALRVAGARSVELWVVARAERRRGGNRRQNALQNPQRVGRTTGHDDVHGNDIGDPSAVCVALAKNAARTPAVTEGHDELRIRHRFIGTA